MSPFLSQVLGVFVRAAVVWVAGYLAAHGGVTLTEDQITKSVTYLVPVVGVIGWSIYSKYLGRVKFLTAASVAARSEREIEQIVSDPTVKNPSVMTRKDEFPS
jgi:type VI protein secretion system component VasK